MKVRCMLSWPLQENPKGKDEKHQHMTTRRRRVSEFNRNRLKLVTAFKFSAVEQLKKRQR